MVMIINGEIVQDNDPRAIAKRGTAAANNKPGGGGGPRIAGINSATTPPSAPGAQPGSGGGQQGLDGLLSPLSRLLGIEGCRVTLPPIAQLNFRGYAFPLVHLAASLVVALLSGDVRYAAACLVALAILNPV